MAVRPEDPRLRSFAPPRLAGARLVMGLGGWMDGGEVSTGTIALLRESLGATFLAEFCPDGFYLHGFPGPMEAAAVFRPPCRIKDGLLEHYEAPRNVFHLAEERRLLLFEGREPNLSWEAWTDVVLSFAERAGVERAYFVGSYGGSVPHSRDPRLHTAASSAWLRDELAGRGLRPTDYEGPAGISTLLLREAARRGLPMAAVVAEIPAYIQGRNPRCIEVAANRLSHILGITLDLGGLRQEARAFETHLNAAVKQNKELAEKVRELEKAYDDDLVQGSMGDIGGLLADPEE